MIEIAATPRTSFGESVCTPVLLPTHTARPAKCLSLSAKYNQSTVTAMSARSNARAARRTSSKFAGSEQKSHQASAQGECKQAKRNRIGVKEQICSCRMKC